MPSSSFYNPYADYAIIHYEASQSFVNGPIIYFSSSIEVTKSMVSGGAMLWGISGSSLDSINSITLTDVTRTSSTEMEAFLGGSYIFGVDFRSLLTGSIETFISNSMTESISGSIYGSRIWLDFSSSGVLLLESGSRTITVNPLSLDFGTYLTGSGSSADYTFTVGGTYLVSDIVITSNNTTNFLLSLTSGSGYTGSVTVSLTGSDVPTTLIHAKFTGSSTGLYSASISCSSTGAITRYVSAQAEIDSYPSIWISPTLIQFYDQPTASYSTGSLVEISGSNLLSDIYISPAPTDFLYTYQTGSFASPFTGGFAITQSDGEVPLTQFYVIFGPTSMSQYEVSASAVSLLATTVTCSFTGAGV